MSGFAAPLALLLSACLHVKADDRHEYLCEARYTCDGEETVALYGPIAADPDDARDLVVLLCADTVRRLECGPCTVECEVIPESE